MNSALRQTIDDREIWPDLLRAVSIIGVILLHSAAPILYAFNGITRTTWWTANIVDSFTRICVPLFFMLSGAMLLDKTKDLQTYFKRRIIKIAIPLLIWSAVYLTYKESQIPTLLHFIKSILAGPVYFHLGFMYKLIFVYLTAPIFGRIFKKPSIKSSLYFGLLWVLIVWLVPYFAKLSGISFIIYTKQYLGMLGYFILGYLIKNVKLTGMRRLACKIILVASFLVTSIGTYYLTLTSKQFNQYFYDSLTPNVIIMSISFYLLFLNSNVNSIKTVKSLTVIRNLSQTSFGIYFLHPLVLELMNKGYKGFRINSYIINPIMGIPLTTLICIGVSFTVIYLIHRLKLSKLLPVNTDYQIRIFG